MLIVPLNLPSVPVPVVPPHTASSSPSSAGKTRRDGPCERLNISDLPLKLGRIHDERLRRRPPASERPILPNAGPERLSDGRRAVRCGATVTRAAHRQPAPRSGRGLYLPDVETTGLVRGEHGWLRLSPWCTAEWGESRGRAGPGGRSRGRVRGGERVGV